MRPPNGCSDYSGGASALSFDKRERLAEEICGLARRRKIALFDLKPIGCLNFAVSGRKRAPFELKAALALRGTESCSVELDF